MAHNMDILKGLVDNKKYISLTVIDWGNTLKSLKRNKRGGIIQMQLEKKDFDKLMDSVTEKGPVMNGGFIIWDYNAYVEMAEYLEKKAAHRAGKPFKESKALLKLKSTIKK